MATDTIITLTAQNFDKMAVQSSVPIMIEFWSEKYTSCQRLTSTMETLAAHYHGTVQFGSVNVDHQPQLASLLGVGGLPSVLVLRDGRVFSHIGGALPHAYYKQLLDHMLQRKESLNCINY